MTPIRILVDTYADAGLLNAQMGNAREIITRLDPEIFHITTFFVNDPDARIATRRNTRLIQLPRRRQTARIFSEFLMGSHDLLFYLKASPSSRWYLSLRKNWKDRKVVVGTIESQCDPDESGDVTPEALRLWEQTILRCDRLYSNSSFVQRSLRKEYGLESDVIPTGADTNFFTPDWNRPRNLRPRVLFVGSLRARKHPELVVSAAERFPEADFRIVGEGPLRERIEAQVARPALKNVILTGALGGKALLDEYRAADIFFFPSSLEGSPKVIVEAAACGVPIICKSSYEPETVLHGVTGFQARSEGELFSFLQQLLADEALRVKMGRQGHQHSRAFDWNLIAEQWANTFLGIARAAKVRCAS